MASITIDNVTKSYRGSNHRESIVALRGVSCEINHEEFAAILGPSGCGKSTLLNILAGFDHPTDGRVLLDGRPIVRPGPDRGVVFQEYALFPWLTVEKNVAFGLRGGSTKERRARVQRYIELVGLHGFENVFPKALSGGMRQRVSLARVLAVDPEVLLMDEPFAALDALTRQIMQRELLRIWAAARKTVIFITHSVDEALVLADRLYLMSARPGRFIDRVDIYLPRPRDLAAPEVNDLRGRVNRVIGDEATRAFYERVQSREMTAIEENRHRRLL